MAWDNRGHSTVAYIAERHLTPRAKANIESYIGGRSIVYYAAWMDFNRSTPPFDVTRDWHVDYWTDAHRTDENGNPQPPCSVSQIKRIVSEMGDFRTLSDSLVNVNIKFLVHLVGDMHCPTHCYQHNTNYKWPCKFKGKEHKTFHGIYDKMPQWMWKKTSATEIAEQIDNCSKGEIKKIQRGTFHDWARDCGEKCAVITEWNPIGTEELNPNTIELSRDLVNMQMRDGGYRLAYLLNKYFGK